LVGKFSERIKVFIGDRTLGNFEKVVSFRYPGPILKLYKLLSCKWQANNVDGFFDNTQCYKIHCFDMKDDVLDIFSSHHHEVAKEYSTINYETNEWMKFYESLKFLFEIEKELYISAKNSTTKEGMKVLI